MCMCVCVYVCTCAYVYVCMNDRCVLTGLATYRVRVKLRIRAVRVGAGLWCRTGQCTHTYNNDTFAHIPDTGGGKVGWRVVSLCESGV